MSSAGAMNISLTILVVFESKKYKKKLLMTFEYLSKAFDRVWHAGLLHELKYYRILGQILGLISSFLSNKWL